MKLQEGDYDNNWIEWNGGKCPVDNGVSIDVRFRNGAELYDVISSLRWSHDGVSGDIIAYRICEQELSPEDAQAEDEEFARIAKESIVTKQERYLQEDGKDLIDKWAERYSPRDFRMIMFAVMERYQDRLGKKDHPAVECRKIADYANRLALVEEGRN